MNFSSEKSLHKPHLFPPTVNARSLVCASTAGSLTSNTSERTPNLRTMNIFFILFACLLAVSVIPVAEADEEFSVKQIVSGDNDGLKARCKTARFRYTCTGCKSPSIDFATNGCFSGSYRWCSDYNYCGFCQKRCTCKRSSCCYV